VGKSDRVVHLGRIPFDPHRVIYATIILVVTLTAAGDLDIDGRDGRGLIDLVTIVFFPLLALSMAHSFSDALDIQIRTGRRLVRSDRIRLFLDAMQYLSVGVPVVIVGIVVSVAGGNIDVAVDVAGNMYALSLIVWGVVAARAAGLGRWVQVRFGLVYGLLGLGIVVVEYAVLH
jgi:hypothetical protein